MESPIESRLRESFAKVKEDMHYLREEVNSLKNEVLEARKEYETLKNEVFLLKEQRLPPPIKNPIFLVSSGNKGVFRQTDTRQTLDRHIFDRSGEIEQLFMNLTEKEFLVFTALYQLGEALKSPISYKTLADELKISQSSVRDHMSELIRKNVPLKKLKINNKTVLLQIDPSFKSLNIMAKILNLRSFEGTQTTLRDI